MRICFLVKLLSRFVDTELKEPELIEKELKVLVVGKKMAQTVEWFSFHFCLVHIFTFMFLTAPQSRLKCISIAEFFILARKIHHNEVIIIGYLLQFKKNLKIPRHVPVTLRFSFSISKQHKNYKLQVITLLRFCG